MQPDAPFTTPESVGPLELLVLQPTPFCNINCSYCYLPDRSSPRRMAPAVLGQALAWVFSSGLVREPFTVLWHAGEPLVVGVPFFEQAAALLAQHNPFPDPVKQSVQTNGTLLDEAWCDFFLRHGVHVGVSVDGPAFLHDRCRQTRQGAGTLDRVLRGIRLLHARGVPFDIITVLTADALNCPDELFDFYQEHGITRVAFNVEEIEGPHTTSSLLQLGVGERFRKFLTRFLDLAAAADPPLAVREFDACASAVGCAGPGPGGRVQENKPFAIVNVDCEGNFSTYSPELLGVPSPRHGGFALGNVARDTLAGVLASERFRRLEEEIGRGVEMCRQGCAYFDFCGGGPPANKYFENGTFASTETMSCRLHKQACMDVTLAWLEKHAPAAPTP
jgi:uncharacterized protein